MDTQKPRVVLTFFDDTIFLTRYDDDGGQQSYPVLLNDVAQALAGVTTGSGLLPPNTLFWQYRGGDERIGIYVPARRWAVTVRTSKEAVCRWTVPMPPLVWVGHGKTYRIWAVKRRLQPGMDCPLYVAPTPNVVGDSAVCAGTVRFPVCSARAIHRALEMFFASHFNGHAAANKCRSHPGSVLSLWRELDGRQRFPLRELVPAERALEDIIEGE